MVADNAVTLAKMAAGTDGNLISYDASGDPVAIATGSEGEVLTSGGAGAAPSFAAAGGAPSHRNDIINGGLVVNQENQTAPADDAYTIGDLFLHVGEGTPVMSLETDGPQGTRPWQKMVLDANAQGGLVYFMSNDDVQDYIANGKLSFGIQLKTTAATISNARIGILKWVGTADAVTSDVVGTWAGDGTNPTLATSWSYENTPANIGLTTSFARHTVEDVTVDSDTKNIAIFIWTDDGTITASDVIGFSEWQLNPGSTVHAFSSPAVTTVRNQVMYYVEQFLEDTPAQQTLGTGYASTTKNGGCTIFWQPKRITPTLTFSASSHFGLAYAASGFVNGGTLGSHDSIHMKGGRLIINNVDGTRTLGDGISMGSISASATLLIDARL